MSLVEIRKRSCDLSIKYAEDLNGYELCSELECFIHKGPALMTKFYSATPINFLNLIHYQKLRDIYPN